MPFVRKRPALMRQLPKKLPSGAWRPGPRNLSMRYHTDPDAPGEGPRITAEFLLNPTEG